MIYSLNNGDLSLGFDDMKKTGEKPKLVVMSDKLEAKAYLATFESPEAAKMFMDVLADFMKAPKIDWEIEEKIIPFPKSN